MLSYSPPFEHTMLYTLYQTYRHTHLLNICRTVAQFTKCSKCSKCFVWRTRTFWIISFAFVSRLYVLLNYGNKYIIPILFLPSFHCPSWVVLMISNVPVTKLCNDLIAHIKIYRIWSLNTYYIHTYIDRYFILSHVHRVYIRIQFRYIMPMQFHI